MSLLKTEQQQSQSQSQWTTKRQKPSRAAEDQNSPPSPVKRLRMTTTSTLPTTDHDFPYLPSLIPCCLLPIFSDPIHLPLHNPDPTAPAPAPALAPALQSCQELPFCFTFSYHESQLESISYILQGLILACDLYVLQTRLHEYLTRLHQIRLHNHILDIAALCTSTRVSYQHHHCLVSECQLHFRPDAYNQEREEAQCNSPPLVI